MQRAEAAAGRETWNAVPHFLLRHAGYPIQDILTLSDPELAVLTDQLIEARARAGEAAVGFRSTLRKLRGHIDTSGASSAVGMLRSVPRNDFDLLAGPG